MRLTRLLLKLSRLDSSLLIALSVFMPLAARTKDLGLSLGRAIPLMFIGMCTFIANDLDDIEKDRVNHPERPLPSGQVATSLAVTLYFICLALALLTTRYNVPEGIAFWYYLLLTISISYGYVVECFPGFKSLYVACAISIPVLIIAFSYPSERKLYTVAASLFLVVLGREMCMDIVDRAGDAASFLHEIDARLLAVVAFFLQSMGIALLSLNLYQPLDTATLVLMTLILTISGHCWFKRARYRQAIILMKLQLAVGLYFLV